jgi:hypothetical protein
MLKRAPSLRSLGSLGFNNALTLDPTTKGDIRKACDVRLCAARLAAVKDTFKF